MKRPIGSLIVDMPSLFPLNLRMLSHILKALLKIAVAWCMQDPSELHDLSGHMQGQEDTLAGTLTPPVTRQHSRCAASRSIVWL